jgi:hypothetical protein
MICYEVADVRRDFSSRGMLGAILILQVHGFIAVPASRTRLLQNDTCSARKTCTELIQGMGKVNGRLVILLDVNHVLPNVSIETFGNTDGNRQFIPDCDIEEE